MPKGSIIRDTIAAAAGPSTDRKANSDSNFSSEDELPPAYSAYSASALNDSSSLSRTATLSTFPSIFEFPVPSISFTSYIPPQSTLSRDTITVTTTRPDLITSSDALAQFLREQIALPPKPEICVKGTHQDWHSVVTDFDIRIDAMRYLLPRKGDQGLSYVTRVSGGGSSLNVAAAPGAVEMTQESAGADDGINAWARAFCDDDAVYKEFILSRKITNWNTGYLERRILALLAACQYGGRVSVSFPVSYTRVVVVQDLGTMAQSFSSAIRSIFTETRKHQVSVTWPYATAPSGSTSGGEVSDRQCLVLSEDAWWKEWKGVIKEAVMAKYVGWLGLEGWMELSMNPSPQKTGKGPEPWGKDKY